MTDFATWWHTEGSGMRPLPNEDVEEFAKRVTEIAWSNGEYVEQEACARICETEWSTTQEHVHGLALADMIRARGQQ
jgi:hypothetical protein